MKLRSPWPAVVLALLVGASAFPFYWAILASFTPEARLFRDPSLLPSGLVLDHYRALFTERSFWLPIRNSLIVAGTTTIFCVTLGALCAYALARLEFKGKTLTARLNPRRGNVSPDLGGVAALPHAP